MDIFERISCRSINNYNYTVKKAEEKFFINKGSRDRYFEMKDDIEKIILKTKKILEMCLDMWYYRLYVLKGNKNPA